MPNHGKGGRKPEREETKRAAVAVRTTPKIKAALMAAAQEAGRSVTQEIEARLEASLAEDRQPRSPETVRLLTAVAADIERAEKLTGRRWHQHVTTWAMVREAMASGEIERQCPEIDRYVTDEDGVIAEQFQQLVRLEWRMDHDAETLRGLGVHIEINGATMLDSTLPRYDFDKVRESMAALDSGLPGAKSLADRLFLPRMEKDDEDRRALATDNKIAWRELAEAIQEGVDKWNANLTARGISTAAEYRPSARMAMGKPSTLLGLPSSPVLRPRKPPADGLGIGLALGAAQRDDDSGRGGNDTR